ncbi:MAG: ubiquinone/menaquinone biosynthesis methyltransferase [Propionibacteriaceae bacterium]|jgi:demethylmenaquinone methyltransferase/2-methoxy-6-polyprenyl-1,4-benzoquinol methylase|nr:ubiquinone/menaquinone biosynthesis methyltransferase [Propionibacteriaceae bacterium]
MRFLPSKRAELDKDPQDIKAMFSATARRYDLVNSLVSLGQVRAWRLEVIEALAPQAGEVILDLAAGTGSSSVPIAAAGAVVIPVDLTEAMAVCGKRFHPDQPFTVGDGHQLPFGDATFDAATMSFGLRNVCDPTIVLAELFRVVRPGGTIVICECSTPTSRLIRKLVKIWLRRGLPILSRLFSSNAPAYAYLGESILAWRSQHELAIMFENAGFTQIQWRNLSFGIVALHRATRP